MFRFFRSIRKSGLKLGNWSEYLKYAIGEIALVVIGILIALQINNWNENVKLAKSEKQLYANIKRQLLEDKSIIEASIEFNNRFINQYQYAIKQIKEKDQQNLDSLAVISVNLLEYSDYHKESNIFSLLVGSGEIKLIKNINVLSSLQKLEEMYIYLNKMETSHFDLIKILYPELKDIISFNPIKVKDVDRFFSYNFLNHFVLATDISMEKDEIYNNTLTFLEDTMKLIDAELELTNEQN